MKKFYLLLVLSCLILTNKAQVPQGINYQAVARNASGLPISEKNISIRIQINNTSAEGELIYSETHSVQTNDIGMFNMTIGKGTPVNNFNFSKIDWGIGGAKWLSIYIDIEGGTNFILIGSSQLLSVPYALYSEKTKTYLPPLMTEQERDAIVNPQQGLEIININTGCINYYLDNCWKEICGVCITPSIKAESNSPVCEGDIINLYATTIPNATYNWTGPNNFVSSEQNPVIKTATLAAAGEYTVSATINNKIISSTTTVIINPKIKVLVNINSDKTEACPGEAVRFEAIPINSGSNPTYQWIKNGFTIADATSSEYITNNLLNNDLISCRLTSNFEGCITNNPVMSKEIKMTILSAVNSSVDIYISGGTLSFCEGSPVYMAALPTKGGTNPAYQWYQNAKPIIGATNVSYSASNIKDKDEFFVMMTTSEKCVTENPVESPVKTINILSEQPVSVSINTDKTNFCLDNGSPTNVIITANPLNPGSNPVYQWKHNNNIVQGVTGSVYSPAEIYDKDSVKCIMTSNENCTTGNPATSNTIKFSVKSKQDVRVYIATNNQSTDICEGDVVTIVAQGINSGNAPTYQWQKNGVNIQGQTNVSFVSNTIQNNDVITCIMTSNLSDCLSNNPAISNELKFTVEPKLPASITISTPKTSVCQQTGVLFTATVTNGGSNPTYQWIKNSKMIQGETKSNYYSYNISDNDIISCNFRSSLKCATNNPTSSNNITMKVIPYPSLADAGADQIGLSGTTATLNANTPEKGDGKWSITSGERGEIADPYNPSSQFTGITGQTYILKWTISNDCSSTSDLVTISFIQ